MPRKNIPKAVKEGLLREFNHRCAICGKDNPHIHHIDEDFNNNESLNLIPLCPNCHLLDHHNPTATVDHKKLVYLENIRTRLSYLPNFIHYFVE